MKTFALIAIFQISFFWSYGQNKSKDHKNCIAINAISFFSPYQRSIDLSYIRKVKSNFHLEIGIAPILPGGNWSDGAIGREQGKGLILKIEPKIVVLKIEDMEGESLNYFASVKIHRTIHDYISSKYEDATLTSIVRYNVNQRVWGIIPHGGFFIQSTRGHVEISIGYGIRKLNISNDYNGSVSALSKTFRFNERYEPEEEGVYYRGSLSLNMKFGYRL